jgi:WD40 repeat protein
MSQQNENEVVSTVDVLNPFPGLRPFKIEESHLFFGREGQSDEVLLKLSKSRFVGVIGPSGSGKSSFIYCGVLPILYGGFLTDASPNWEVIVTRPGAGPIDNLSESLLRSTREYHDADTEDKKIKRTIVSTLLRSSSLGLVEAIQQSRRSADVNYLILVDQFEELFRFKDSTDPNSVDETLAFVNLLMEAVNYEDAPIYVAITMRSDFIGDCAQFPDLTRKINDSHYLIPQMTRDQKRRAIEGPVAVGGAKIAPRLVQQLLNDLGDNPDQLPILQHSLMRTWSYWSRYKDYDDESVDLKHYEAIGTMSEALSQHANEAFDELDDEQKRICEALFKAITEKRGENFGIRRPTRLNEIAAIADVSEEDVTAVLEKFREPGRSLLTPAHGTPLHSRSMVDISHESLMRIWTRLKNWVDDEAEAVQMYLRLAEAAAQYQVGKAGLWRPPDLQLALNWQTKHNPTLVWGQRYHPAFERTLIFLEYSKKEFETEQRIKELEAKRKLRNARITAMVLGTATVISLMFLVFALVQRTKAEAARVQAEEAMVRAVASEKEAKIQEAAAKRNAEIAEQNAILAQQQKAIAEENEAAANVARAEAVKNADEAKRQEGIALRNADAARRAQSLAETNEKRAKEEEAKAQAERYRAIAKAMAIKSRELGNNPEQEALIAQQAHNFNDKYAGYVFDNDVYNGLFRALANNGDPMTLSLEGHLKGAARALETRVNSNHIYSGGSDGRIMRWTQDPSRKWTAETIVGGRTDYLVFTLDISPDEAWLAAGGSYPINRAANYVELYDLRNIGAAPKKIAGFNSDIGDIHFTNDNKGFYARDNSGHSIRYSDLNTAKEVIASKEKINYLDISPDGKKLVGAGNEGNLYIWDIQNNYAQTVLKIDIAGRGLTAASFTPDGNQLVTGNAYGLIRIVSNGVVVRELSGHTSAIEHIKFNFKGNFMATASKDFSIRLWNYRELEQPPMVLSDHDWVWSVAFTPNDDQLMAGINSVKEEIGKTNQTIHAWPTNINSMSDKLCTYAKRNMSQEEWALYVGKDLPYLKTCQNLPENNK